MCEDGCHSAEDSEAKAFESGHQIISALSLMFEDPLTNLFMFLVHRDAPKTFRQGSGDFSGRIGQSVGYVLDQGSDVALGDESGHAFRHIIDETQRIAQEIRRTQDFSGLRLEFVLKSRIK